MTDRELEQRLHAEAPQTPVGFEARHDALLRQLIGKEEVVMKRKLSLGILLALLLLVLALGVSLAVGLGVFGQFADEHQDARLQNLENYSETYEEETRVESAGDNFPEVQFTLTQAHYDGQSLYVAYRLSGASIPLIYLDPDGAVDVDWDFTPEDGVFTDWEAAVSPDEYKKLKDTLAKEGRVFLEVHEQGLGDGASLADGTYINPSRSDGQMQADGTWVGYTEFEFPLPEAAQNQESLTLEFSLLRSSRLYYEDTELRSSRLHYADAEGGTYFKLGDRIEPIKLTAVVRRNGENQMLQGQGRFDAYTADIAATLSNVDIKAECNVDGPQEWIDAWDTWSSEADALWGYNLYADGVLYEPTGFSCSTQGGKLQFLLDFACPASIADLRLRPVYSQSGEKPEEDILLK